VISLMIFSATDEHGSSRMKKGVAPDLLFF